MLQNLSQEIRECLRRVEECTRLAKTAVTAGAINDYLEMEQRWLALARSYEFAERLSNFTAVQEPQTAEKADVRSAPNDVSRPAARAPRAATPLRCRRASCARAHTAGENDHRTRGASCQTWRASHLPRPLGVPSRRLPAGYRRVFRPERMPTEA